MYRSWWMTLDAWGLQGFAIATVQTIFYAYFLWIGTVFHWRDGYWEHLGTIISKNPLNLQVISKSSPNSKTARVLQVNLHSSIGLMGFWRGLPDPGQAAKKDQHVSKQPKPETKNISKNIKDIKKDPNWLTILETWGNLWDRAQLHHPLLECGTLPKAQELCYTFRHVLGNANALAGVKFGEFEDETKKNTTTQLAGYRLVVSTAQGAFEGTMTMMPRRPT